MNEVNQSPTLLPNTTLGFKIYDACYSEMKALHGTLTLLSRQNTAIPNYHCNFHSPMPGIVGDSPSKSSMPMARILGLYMFPQISYGAAVSPLSNKRQFPSFFRTVPNDSFQPYGLAQMMMRFGWNWVGIVVSDNDYGILGGYNLKAELMKVGGCVDYLEIIPKYNFKNKILEIINLMERSSVHVVVLYSALQELVPFMEEVSMSNLSTKTWIGVTGWSLTPVFMKKEILKVLNGTITFALFQGRIPGLKEFIYSTHPATSPDDIFVKLFWETAFECKWPSSIDNNVTANVNKNYSKICSGQEVISQIDVSILDVYNFRYTYCIYKAVYAFAHALHGLLSCHPSVQAPFINQTCANITNIHPWQLTHYLRSVYFKNTAGDDVFFDVNGDPPAVYDILSLQILSDFTSNYVKVGGFDSRAPKGWEIFINDSAIVWKSGHKKVPRSLCTEPCQTGFRKVTRKGQPVCCFDCIPCSKGEISNQTDSSDCMKCPLDSWPDGRRQKCVPRDSEFLAYEDPVGAVLTAVSLCLSLLTVSIFSIFIKFRDTPIVKANNRGLSYVLLLALTLCFLSSLIFIGMPEVVKCMLRQVVFGTVFTLSISSILAKTVTVVVAFNATRPNSKLQRWVGTRIPNSVVFLCTAIQVILCTTWLATFPPSREMNTESEDGRMIFQCNEGSIVMFYCMLGYMGLLATISFVIAFLARKLPDSFNEAKYITFSMIVFVSVWLSFIPAYMSTRGRYMVAVEVFAILSSSAGLLACIFLPKCYIILLKPERNTREWLTGKQWTRAKWFSLLTQYLTQALLTS
ncbi:extracellular calcium-sensing receptor-like [Protopterus annectens]|uniref:extracellular calcium-sensing receptor-like n=1 Tax=Protopterus annectens TaxID=7888 RepID=UPI001CFADB01|nr:extracellular calcium-sensing receptor-like [Protopterus annectens]